jgi:hypothetical protein
MPGIWTEFGVGMFRPDALTSKTRKFSGDQPILGVESLGQPPCSPRRVLRPNRVCRCLRCITPEVHPRSGLKTLRGESLLELRCVHQTSIHASGASQRGVGVPPWQQRYSEPRPQGWRLQLVGNWRSVGRSKPIISSRANCSDDESPR